MKPTGPNHVNGCDLRDIVQAEPEHCRSPHPLGMAAVSGGEPDHNRYQRTRTGRKPTISPVSIMTAVAVSVTLSIAPKAAPVSGVHSPAHLAGIARPTTMPSVLSMSSRLGCDKGISMG